MAVRFYLVPLQAAVAGAGGIPEGNYNRPKYLQDAGVTIAECATYGADAHYLVAADVTAGQHSAINANADVTAIPQNLDQQIGAALATVQSEMEARNIPAGWVTAVMTYRTVMRMVRRLFAFMQRFYGMHRRTFFELGITLDTTIGSLTQNQRAALQAVADDRGLDTSSITGSTTIRQALKIVADQMPPITMMREVF